jgi:hypothetical protein
MSKAKIVNPSDEALRLRQRETDERARFTNAQSIAYIPKKDAFALLMSSGIRLQIPRDSIEEFRRVSKGELSEVELGPGGGILVLESLDLHISLPGLLRDLFGLNVGQRAGGRATSKAKTAAARANGARGGRPRKVA